MVRTTLKGILAHKLRLALTALSVMIGVALIAGTFIFTDTIDRTFGELFDNAFAGQDVIVQSETEFDVGFRGPPPFDEAVLDMVLAVPGVAAAGGNVGGFAVIYDRDGGAIVPLGPPTLGGSWAVDERLLGAAELREGRGPQGPAEMTVDARTAKDNELAVGDQIQVQTVAGVGSYEIVGIVGFGKTDNLAGATFAGFDLQTAQTLFELEGLYSSIIALGEEEVAPSALRDRIALAIPEGIEVVIASDEAAEQAEALSEDLGFIRTVLLVFGGVAVFVAGFIIQNTFRIIIRQRQRELALMRAVGATGAQVVMMVVAEAMVVGVIASAIGIGLGFGFAWLITFLMSLGGFDLPSTTAPLAVRTVVIGVLTGVVITVLSAVLPAIRASRIPPVAALRDVDIRLRMSDRTRAVLGGIALLAGTAIILLGLFADVQIGPINELIAVGVGASVVFLAVSLVSSNVVKPLVTVLTSPLRRLDAVTATLASQNSIRKPRRTATTASALMIGIALVATFFVLGDSIKTSTGQAIERGLRADYVVSADGFVGGFSPVLSEELDTTEEIEATTSLRLGFWDRGGSEELLMAIEAETAAETIFLDVKLGDLQALAEGGVFVHKNIAEDEEWTVGTNIPMGFVTTGLQQVEVVGIYGEQNVVQSSFLVGLDFYEENFKGSGSDTDFAVMIKAAGGIPPEISRAAVEKAAADYPNARVRDQVEYRKSQNTQVNILLGIFNALLALAILIALFGITNTLSLSVFERTREIGLLRAVGMSQRQVRRLVRYESIMVAVLGALLGIVIGIFFGVVITTALGSFGITSLSIPLAQILSLLIVGVVVGLIAAVVPARSASRLNMLEAISYE